MKLGKRLCKTDVFSAKFARYGQRCCCIEAADLCNENPLSIECSEVVRS